MFLYIFPIICACIIVATSFGSRQILPLTIDGITNDRALDYITLSFAFAVGQVIWGFANYIGGMVADKFGDEKALFLGIILSAMGCYLIQYCDSTFDIVIAVGLLSAGGAGIAGVAGFNALHALSTRNEDPQTASRPFDKDRDGFVLGEGAGALVIESLEHAQKRGATIYCEIVGGGLSADAYHMTAPHPEGIGATLVMENALKDANVSANEVDAINMHGTSTPLGDVAESGALKKVFGDHLYNMNINSTKSMTGHLLGAAGAVEAISTILSIQHGIVPPTINHFTEDENIDPKINFTFNKAQERDVNVAMSNTFGFGGHNACVVMRKFV